MLRRRLPNIEGLSERRAIMRQDTVRRQSLSVFRLFASQSKPTFRTCFAETIRSAPISRSKQWLCLCGPASEDLFCGPITDGTEQADYWIARDYPSRPFDALKVAAEIVR